MLWEEIEQLICTVGRMCLRVVVMILTLVAAVGMTHAERGPGTPIMVQTPYGDRTSGPIELFWDPSLSFGYQIRLTDEDEDSPSMGLVKPTLKETDIPAFSMSYYPYRTYSSLSGGGWAGWYGSATCIWSGYEGGWLPCGQYYVDLEFVNDPDDHVGRLFEDGGAYVANELPQNEPLSVVADPKVDFRFLINVLPYDVDLDELDFCPIPGTAGAESCQSSTCNKDIPMPSTSTYGAMSNSANDPIRAQIPELVFQNGSVTECRVYDEHECSVCVKIPGSDTAIMALFRDKFGRMWKTRTTNLGSTNATQLPRAEGFQLYDDNGQDCGKLIRIQYGVTGPFGYYLSTPDGKKLKFKFDGEPAGPSWRQTAWASEWDDGPLSGPCPIGGSGSGNPSIGRGGRIEETDGKITKVITEDGLQYILTYEYDAEHGVTNVKITRPDLSYATLVFPGSSVGVNSRPIQIMYYDKHDALMAQVNYTYRGDGKIEQVQLGTRTISYKYDDAHRTVTMTEESARPQVQTVYHYAWDGEISGGEPAYDDILDTAETWIIKKGVYAAEDSYQFHPENGDVKIVKKFAVNTFGTRTKLISSTDECGNTTSYNYTVPSDNIRGGHGDYLDTVIDANGLSARFEYNYGYPSKIQVQNGGAYGSLGEVTTSYYSTPGATKTIKDVRGNYLHFDRNESSPGLVDRVKVSSPVSGNEPDWTGVSPLCSYEYYGTSTDISSVATIGHEEGYESLPDWSPHNLNDGQLGIGHADKGLWTISPVSGDTTKGGNSSTWEWASPQDISVVKLYLDGTLSSTELSDTLPEKITILAKDEK